MFDNLREASGQGDLFEEPVVDEAKVSRRGTAPRLFGMTAIQRLILSLLLLGTVLVMGLMCLVVFEKVYL